jgi:hypothetical protein
VPPRPDAAQASGAGAEIDDVIGALDGFGIVLHHQHGVAEIAQTAERIEQAVVIARMQADGRLVQNIQHAAQLRSDLRGQADALGFAAGERGGGTRQAQIIEADGGEKLQAIADLFDDAPAICCSRSLSFQALTVASARSMDISVSSAMPGALHAHRQTAGAQTAAVAIRTKRRRHIVHQPLAITGAGFFVRFGPEF